MGYPPIFPTLNAVARPGVAPSGLTFTRASTATRVNALGLIESVSAGTLRHDFHPVTGEYKGWLIEESRTNLIPNSGSLSSFVLFTGTSMASDGTLAPDGVSPAVKLTSVGATIAYINTSIAADSRTYTRSLFVKRGTSPTVTIRHLAHQPFEATYNFDTGMLSGSGAITAQPFANGWVRIGGAGTNDGIKTILGYEILASPTISGGYTYVWGAQAEVGVFPTSYIPTASAAATSAADLLTVPVSAFPFNPAEGTLYCHGTVLALRYSPLLQLDADSAANRIFLDVTEIGTMRAVSTVAGSVSGMASSSGTVTAGTAFRTALAYSSAGVGITLNGAAPVTAAAALPSGITKLRVGTDSQNITSGHIRHIAYFPRRLSTADLQTITA